MGSAAIAPPNVVAEPVVKAPVLTCTAIRTTAAPVATNVMPAPPVKAAPVSLAVPRAGSVSAMVHVLQTVYLQAALIAVTVVRTRRLVISTALKVPLPKAVQATATVLLGRCALMAVSVLLSAKVSASPSAVEACSVHCLKK